MLQADDLTPLAHAPGALQTMLDRRSMHPPNTSPSTVQSQSWCTSTQKCVFYSQPGQSLKFLGLSCQKATILDLNFHAYSVQYVFKLVSYGCAFEKTFATSHHRCQEWGTASHPPDPHWLLFLYSSGWPLFLNWCRECFHCLLFFSFLRCWGAHLKCSRWCFKVLGLVQVVWRDFSLDMSLNMQPDPCSQQLIACVVLYGTPPFTTGIFLPCGKLRHT